MRDLPAGNRLKLLIRAFNDACPDVPTDLLGDVYKLSLRIRDDDGRPIYWDARAMAVAWEQNPDLRGRKAALQETTESSRINCQMCFGSNFRPTRAAAGPGKNVPYEKCNHREGR